jgi:hypothetical protein
MENLSKDVAVQIEDYQKTTLFVGIFVLILHLLAFLVTVIVSFIDVQIALQFGYLKLADTLKETTTWTAYALNDATFS